jgi:hypothetical protein
MIFSENRFHPQIKSEGKLFGIMRYCRMWPSTAAVGQQSTFRPFFF